VSFADFTKQVQRLIQERGFLDPTEPQSRALPLILEGKNVLLLAPTGTGKTEAAFLPIINKISSSPRTAGVKALYITPLRALNRDLLERLEWWCKNLDIRLMVRHGDTSLGERSAQAAFPPDILITTPETLQALLTGKVMRRHLKSLSWIVVDEVHELAGEKRGSQLSVGLERLKRLTDGSPQIIGLSATVGNPQEVASFLVGSSARCEVVRVPVAKMLSLEVIYPDAKETDEQLAAKLYTYPQVAARLRVIRELLEKHRSTLIFTNTRSEAEVLTNRFRVWDANLPIGIHHGSLSKASRIGVERDLKDGKLSAIICTSSLELGIDIGDLDLVIQYNSPRQVSRLIQRVGRSGHRIGATAKGVIITQDSDDTLEALVIAQRAYREELERLIIPQSPLDSLTHQIAGLLVEQSRWYVDDALQIVKNAYPYIHLSREEFERCLNYLHQRTPRLAWYSEGDGIFTRPLILKGLFEYYFDNLSMIPEERQFLVVDESGRPVGVLDEAFVAENGQPGVKFVEAGSVWRIDQLYKDKVYVKSDPDPIGAIPTWVGDEIPVPFEVARDVGALRREVEEKLTNGIPLESIISELAERYPGSEETIRRALLEVHEQYEEGIPIPTDRRITVEQWGQYLIVQCAFGHLVNRALSRILALMISKATGMNVAIQQDPYRIILKVSVSPEFVIHLIRQLRAPLRDLFVEAVSKSGIFKRRLVHVARKFGAISKDADVSALSLEKLTDALMDTPIYGETIKTILQVDVDLDRLEKLLGEVATGAIELVSLGQRSEPSPLARIGLEETARRVELIPADRLKALIRQSTKTRLLNERVMLVCVNCWRVFGNIRVKDALDHPTCQGCNSSMFGATDEEDSRVNRLCSRLRAGLEPAKDMKRLRRQLLASARLLSKNIFPGLVALVGSHMNVPRAESIMKAEPEYGDRLIELIIEEDRKGLARRFALGKPSK